jgi:hypothetical protein
MAKPRDEQPLPDKLQKTGEAIDKKVVSSL